MYLTFSKLNSIHWLIIIIKKKNIGLNVLFRTFHDNFQVKLYPPKFFFFNFYFIIRYIYANVFKIFKFELNPLDNKKDIGLYVLFRTFHDNFQVKLFPLKKVFFSFIFQYSLNIC